MLNNNKQQRRLPWLLWLLCIRNGVSYIAHTRFPDNPLPLHLQTENPPRELTLRAAVLHSDPFAIVTEDRDGYFSVHGLQKDLVDRIVELAREDAVKLTFELDPWKKSGEQSYSSALDLVANDCQDRMDKLPEDSEITAKYNCSSFDLIIGDFFSTSDRYLRVDMTPPWLSNAIATMKYVGDDKDRKVIEDDDGTIGKGEISTLAEASNSLATVCVQKDTPSSAIVMWKFPKARYLQCSDDQECFDYLRDDRCVLFARDEMFLLQKDNEDSNFEVTRERFNTQYMVWPMRYDLPPSTSYLIKRWIKRAIEETTMDDLYHEYFAKKVCPIGKAGENCDLPCDPDHGYSDRRSGKCICESTKYTGDDCSIEVQEDLNLIPTTLKAISYGLFGIICLAILFSAVWIVRFRKSDQVRAGQPFFLMLVLLGCFISSSAIISLAQEEEVDGSFGTCMGAPWLYSVGFCVTFGTLFAKIRRVYLVFHQAIGKRNKSTSCFTANYAASHKDAALVSFKETLLIIGVVTCIDVAILVAWTVADPMEWLREVTLADKFGRPLASQGRCTSEHIGLFAGLIGALHLLLLGSGCYLCYKARKIPTMFQEGKYVSLALGSNLQIFLVGVPIILLESDPQTSFIVKSVIIGMNNLVVIVLIFGNLIYKSLRASNSLSDSDVKGKISKAVTQYATTPKGASGENSSGSPNNRSDLTFNRVIEISDEDEEEAEQDAAEEGRTLDIPQTPTSRSRRSIVSSLSMDSEGKSYSNHLPAKRSSRNMISSLSMDSQSGLYESMAVLSQGGLPTLQELSVTSSISSSKGRRKGGSSNRSVTFGMAYSENEDGSEMAIPLEPLPPRDESPDASSSKQRRSLARFNSDSVKAAPPKAPKRDGLEGNSSPFGDLTTVDRDRAARAESTLDRSTEFTAISSKSGPPSRPIRKCSNPSLCDESEKDHDDENSDSGDIETGCCQPPEETPETHKPPARPTRKKSAEGVEKAPQCEEPRRERCISTAITEPPTPSTRNGSFTKLHPLNNLELLDGSIPHEEIGEALLDSRRSPPQPPKRLPSGSTLSDMSRCSSVDSGCSGAKHGGSKHSGTSKLSGASKRSTASKLSGPLPPLPFPSGKAA